MFQNTFFAFMLLALYLLSFEVTGTIASGTARPKAIHRSPGGALLPYPSVPMLYNGTINGSNVVMRGSLGEIYEQLGLEFPAMNNAKDQTGNDVETAVVPRSKADCNCIPVPGNEQWKGAYVWSLKVVIRNIANLNGGCTFERHSCHRVGCYYGSAVHLCNDGPKDLRMKCSNIASYAQDVLDKCYVKKGRTGVEDYAGQNWDTDMFNVIVINEGCGSRSKRTSANLVSEGLGA